METDLFLLMGARDLTGLSKNYNFSSYYFLGNFYASQNENKRNLEPIPKTWRRESLYYFKSTVINFK